MGVGVGDGVGRRRSGGTGDAADHATGSAEHGEAGDEHDDDSGRRERGLERCGHAGLLPQEAPRGPLSLTVHASDGFVEDMVRDLHRAVGEPGVQEAFDVSIGGHAVRPPSDLGARVRLEGGPHRAVGVVQSGSDRARRDAEDLGDLGRGIAREVVQGEHDPLVGRQPPEPAFELVPVGDRQELVGRRRSVDRQHPKVGHATPFPARLADADVDQELLEPRVEPVRIAERPQVTPGDHQRVLEGILGPIDVAEDPLCDREQPVGARTDQVDVRLPVAALGRLDEIAIHGRPSWRPIGGAVRLYWSPSAPCVQDSRKVEPPAVEATSAISGLRRLLDLRAPAPLRGAVRGPRRGDARRRSGSPARDVAVAGSVARRGAAVRRSCASSTPSDGGRIAFYEDAWTTAGVADLAHRPAAARPRGRRSGRGDRGPLDGGLGGPRPRSVAVARPAGGPLPLRGRRATAREASIDVTWARPRSARRWRRAGA